ncbi:MAG: glucose-1-phosphate adenylyltransferase [Spirochaetales bacterium]|nr:glucose-1-phosphate adenylyltransferase [Spirochaetales bacterium]
MNSKVMTIILGGGKGTRLFPLTKERAKPAVPFGGKFRLIDIPISNSINSGLNHIYILTQFESASLNTHISQSYRFDMFSGGFVEILAASQNYSNNGWYEGTADAVRKNLNRFHPHRPDIYLILSGDQLYKMDIVDFLRKHRESGADISIAATPVTRGDAEGLGILKIDDNERITDFVEKPKADEDISSLRVPGQSEDPSKEYLASMGIYLFNADVMEKCLDNDFTDFGHQIIPEAINTHKVQSYVYDGYWEDIGTIGSFYDANLNLASPLPNYNLYDEISPVYTRMRNLPPSKMLSCNFNNAMAAEGSIISHSSISNSIVGIRTIIRQGASLDGVYSMGADLYETDEDKEENREKGIPHIGIGAGTIIKRAIIDKNARIGSNCRIGVDDHIERKDGDYGSYHIVDGIIVIHKDAVLSDGTVI